MSRKIKICKLLLSTVGRMLPLNRHPGGRFANKARCFITKGIVKSMGKNCVVEKGAEIHEDCVLADGAAVGVNCMVGPGTVFLGKNMMGPDVRIYTVNHRYNPEKHCFDGNTAPMPVTIGHDVWIGYGTIILPGVTIGSNVVIGAGSVVTKDIPSGVMAAGNPCTVKKIIDGEVYENFN